MLHSISIVPSEISSSYTAVMVAEMTKSHPVFSNVSSRWSNVTDVYAGYDDDILMI